MPTNASEKIELRNDTSVGADKIEGFVAPPPELKKAEVLTRHPQSQTQRVPAQRKAQFVVTFCHWSIVALLILETLTGMRMGWGYAESPLGGPRGGWASLLDLLSPRGTLFGINLMTLHNVSAWLLLADVIVYVGYLFYSRACKRLKVSVSDIQAIKQAAVISGFWQSKKALWSANLAVYWFGFLTIAILLFTGIALYRVDLGLYHYMGGYKATHVVHALFTYLLFPFTLVHVLLQWRFGTLWSIFKASFVVRHLTAGCIGIDFAIVLAGVLYIWNQQPETLEIGRIGKGLTPPVIDGNPGDAIWNTAQTKVIKTVKGIHNRQDEVTVSVTAVHDGQQIYFRFQWDDAEPSLLRSPLVKTPRGWMLMPSGKKRDDEDVSYEDKFAVYLTKVANNRGCASTCHLGDGKPGTPKGMHYTEGEIGDLWYWKALSKDATGVSTHMGNVDDEYFGPLGPPPEEPWQRSVGGHYPDPGTGGGYQENFVKLKPQKSLHDTAVRPLKFPPHLEDELTKESNLKMTIPTWLLEEQKATSYSKTLDDRYPTWAVIPSTLFGPASGDRADIRSEAKWSNGKWTLELTRALDTQSPYDLPFRAGKDVYLSVAAFNRTALRHSEHLRPIRVVLLS